MNPDDNNPDLQPWIEPELEARIVAAVLGEASDFEAAELERLAAEKPELAIFRRRIEAVHGLVGAASRPGQPWRLAPERRRKILAAIGGPAVAAPGVTALAPRARGWWRSPGMLRVAAGLMIGGIVAFFVFPFLVRSEKAAPRKLAFSAASPGAFGDSESLQAPVSEPEAARAEESLSKDFALDKAGSPVTAGISNSAMVAGSSSMAIAPSAAPPGEAGEPSLAAGEKQAARVGTRGGGAIDASLATNKAELGAETLGAIRLADSDAAFSRGGILGGILGGQSAVSSGTGSGGAAGKDGAASPSAPKLALLEHKQDLMAGLRRDWKLEAGDTGLGNARSAADNERAKQGAQAASAPAPSPVELAASAEPFSTFSLHVSDVSFQLARDALARGERPDPARIRPEEFYNAFDYGDPAPGPGEQVAARIEQSTSPFGQQRNLVRIAIKAAAKPHDPAAQNVRVQVRWNPQRVGKSRLIGFEMHRMGGKDFRDDKGGAAELAGEGGVALYEIEPLSNGEGELGEVSVRFPDPVTGEMAGRAWTIPYDARTPAFHHAPPSMQLAGLAAVLAEKLRGSSTAAGIDLDALAPLLTGFRRAYPHQLRCEELARMWAQAPR